MAQLNSIIGSILRDMVLAQHQANLYAASLKEMYSKDGSLERFSMPGIAIGDLELDLNYAIQSSSGENDGTNNDAEQFEINYAALSKCLHKIAESYAEIVLSSAVGTLKKLFPVESSTGENPLAKFEESVALLNQFESFLSHKMLEGLRTKFTQLLTDEGKLNKQNISEAIVEVGQKEVVRHPDLNALLDKQPESETKLKQSITAAVENSIEAILADMNVMRKRLIPSAEVIVGSEELSKLPSDSIQRLRLKLTPREIQLYDEPTE